MRIERALAWLLEQEHGRRLTEALAGAELVISAFCLLPCHDQVNIAS
jgi:hypothetical protein